MTNSCYKHGEKNTTNGRGRERPVDARGMANEIWLVVAVGEGKCHWETRPICSHQDSSGLIYYGLYCVLDMYKS